MERELSFVKMHGCGNDYIYFNCFEDPVARPEELSRRLSDRHKGIGGDGIVLIGPSKTGDAQMRMFNLDGSEGKMCGNAIRCVAKFLWESSLVRKEEMIIETLSGLKTCRVHPEGGKAPSVTVDMGRADFDPKRIPVKLPEREVIGRKTQVAGGSYEITCVSMGNPHCVVFGEDPETLPLEELGPRFEHDPLFPEQVNTEFVKVLNSHALKMRVWERGSGETMACGTGACAAVAAAVRHGDCPEGENVTVHLRGGDLVINFTGKRVLMTGEAVEVFRGTIAADA